MKSRELIPQQALDAQAAFDEIREIRAELRALPLRALPQSFSLVDGRWTVAPRSNDKGTLKVVLKVVDEELVVKTEILELDGRRYTFHLMA